MSLTHGASIGTPRYMSPEQTTGRSVITPSSDVYSLGVVAFELLSGRRPFDADEPFAVMRMHVQDPPPAITSLAPELPSQLDAVFERCLAKDPTLRFPSAIAFHTALARVLETTTPESVPIAHSASVSGADTVSLQGVLAEAVPAGTLAATGGEDGGAGATTSAPDSHAAEISYGAGRGPSGSFRCGRTKYVLAAAAVVALLSVGGVLAAVTRDEPRRSGAGADPTADEASPSSVASATAVTFNTAVWIRNAAVWILSLT